MSAITDKVLKAVPLYTDTLAGAISNATVTTFTVTNGSTDLENGEVYEVTIDRVDANGASTGRREVVVAQYTSATKTFDCSTADYRGVEGTAQSHPIGAVVEILVTAHYLNQRRAAFVTEHNQDGTHKTTSVVTLTATQTLTNKTLTSPKVGTAILDANGNEVIKTPATASAVNEVTVTNSATGNAVAISATGGDDNISLNLVSKGTGTIQANGVAVTTDTSTATLTNKRMNKRVVSTTSYTTDTGTSLSVATADEFVITAQAGALKFNNPGGTPTEGQRLIIRIKDNGTARALTYDTYFRAMGVSLPTTTVLGKTLYMGFIFNETDTKWDLVATAQEA